MQKIRINRDELHDIVVGNKRKHIDAYNEAVVDYFAAVTKICQENLVFASSNLKDSESRIKKIKSLPTPPSSYEAEYNRAIRMLELSVDDIIELDTQQFDQLVQDIWVWKTSFITTNSIYKKI